MLGTMYSYFRTKLVNFVSGDESLNKIAVVSHIAEGVAAGLKDTSPSSLYVVTCLSAKFITDFYGGFLKEKGGLVSTFCFTWAAVEVKKWL